MGGLFSSEPPRPQPVPVASSNSYYTSSTTSNTRPNTVRDSYRTSHPSYNTTSFNWENRQYGQWSSNATGSNASCNINNLQRDFESLKITKPYVPPPTRSQRIPFFLDISVVPGQVLSYIQLTDYDIESQQVRRLITNKRNFKVDAIYKIENRFLQKAYQLKKEQKELVYDHVDERFLFHGTTEKNIDKICTMNFDWRKCQAHLYGKGVSFSPNCNYASTYSEEGVYNKVMILAKVLIGRSCIGSKEMVLPLDFCDTSQKGVDGIVIVKYDDHEFLPMYKIEYHLIFENKRKYKGRAVNCSIR